MKAKMTFGTAALGRLLAISGMALVALAVLPQPGHAMTKVEKTFGSWVSTCVDNDDGSRNCRLTQQRVDQKTRRPVFAFVVGGPKKDQLTLTLYVPTGMSLKEGVTLTIGETAPLTLPYAACAQVCSATLAVDAKLAALIKANRKALVGFVQSNKKLVQIDVDLTGFNDGFTYLQSQIP